MGEDFITYEDLPIREDYISQIEDLGIKIDKRLKWFNAVSAYLNHNQKTQVMDLPFIEKVEYVRKFKFRSPETDTPPIILKQPAKEF